MKALAEGSWSVSEHMTKVRLALYARFIKRETTYIRANASLDGLLVLKQGVHMSVCYLGQGKVVVPEGDSVYDVVPECRVAAWTFVLVL